MTQYGDSGSPFNGGAPGTLVTPGQYALDWVRALGGDIALDANGTGIVVTLGVPWPNELQALVGVWQSSIIAAIQGKVYPPDALTCPRFGFGTVVGLPFTA